MRPALLTGLFAIAVVAAPSSISANAEKTNFITPSKIEEVSEATAILPMIEKDMHTAFVPRAIDPKPQPKIHSVGPNENLEIIAKQNGTDWYRIFNKNEQLSHPDLVKPGDKLAIPEPTEKLPERPLPESTAPADLELDTNTEQPVRTIKTKRSAATATTTVRRGSASGNTYAPGYCTWYAKNMRPDLPNNLGNANTWVSRAAAQGIPTGSTPRVGAIGQQGMHVVYVERVNGDGTVFISEMNYRGLYVTSTRTVAASSFTYIY
jgi:surface antigen